MTKRVLLKLSGETLSGSNAAIQQESCKKIASSIKALKEQSVEIAIVIGGGNIFRGIQAGALGLERTPADQMGMLATLINGVALQQSLASVGCPSRVLSALECPKVVETYTWRAAQEYLKKGEVLIFVGGTGNPYFTTDTAAAMRASEIHADMLLKATKVDGIYDKDPLKHGDAKKYERMTYSQVLAEKLEVMDATSIALCRQSRIPIYVFNMKLLEANTVPTLLKNMSQGTLVQGE